MSEGNSITSRLWTPAGFTDDAWTYADTLEASNRSAGVILGLGEFLALDDEACRSARDRLGVLLQPGDMLDSIVPRLGVLRMVALAFPTFTDGRSLSKAQLLRSRHAFGGIVRATGQVLVDQLPHMTRVGFDQFEIAHPVLLRRLEAGEAGGIALHYQPAAKPAANDQVYSWRRRRLAV